VLADLFLPVSWSNEVIYLETLGMMDHFKQRTVHSGCESGPVAPCPPEKEERPSLIKKIKIEILENYRMKDIKIFTSKMLTRGERLEQGD
jgi:hypothetical protein